MSPASLSFCLVLATFSRAQVAHLHPVVPAIEPAPEFAVPSSSPTPSLRLSLPTPASTMMGPRPTAAVAPDAAGADSAATNSPAAARQLFDGEEPARPAPPKKDVHGLRFLGVELGGAGPAPGEDETYVRKGVNYLDWDVHARLPINGLGLRTNYRHPRGFRGFSVGFLKYYDWPGLWSGRDSLYASVGAGLTKPLGGFQLSASSVIDEHWGGAVSYDRLEAQAGARWSLDRAAALSLGFSPLGDNPGKLWNFALTGSVTHEDLSRSEPLITDERQGIGWTLGVAFQEALTKLPMGWARPVPLVGHGILRPDRLKITAYTADSQISSLSLNASIELAFYLGPYLQLTPGVHAQWRPAPDSHNPDETSASWGGMFGLGIDNLGF